MGECTDFHVGEPVNVWVSFHPPHRMTLAGVVRFVWDEFIDVGVGDTVIRFPRAAFDCQDLEVGGPCTASALDFEQHFTTDEYDPEAELHG